MGVMMVTMTVTTEDVYWPDCGGSVMTGGRGSTRIGESGSDGLEGPRIIVVVEPCWLPGKAGSFCCPGVGIGLVESIGAGGGVEIGNSGGYCAGVAGRLVIVAKAVVVGTKCSPRPNVTGGS